MHQENEIVLLHSNKTENTLKAMTLLVCLCDCCKFERKVYAKRKAEGQIMDVELSRVIM